jgi:hypothetical protein
LFDPNRRLGKIETPGDNRPHENGCSNPKETKRQPYTNKEGDMRQEVFVLTYSRRNVLANIAFRRWDLEIEKFVKRWSHSAFTFLLSFEPEPGKCTAKNPNR